MPDAWDLWHEHGDEVVRDCLAKAVGPGAALLDDVFAFLGRFVAYPSHQAQVAHTLWCLHAHLMEAWESTPRMAFLSPEPGSGKTRALEVTELLVPRPMRAANMSASALYRSIGSEDGPPTVLLDEVDAVFSKKSSDSSEDLRGLLNAGHGRGAVIKRCVPRGRSVDVEDFPCFAAVALAGLGDLPDTLMSRSIVIRMRRQSDDERAEPFRTRLHRPAGEELRDRVATWAASVEEKLRNAWPELPDGVCDRPADCWEPLLAIADAAGGHWPDQARGACVSFVTQSQGNAGSLGVMLLTDLRTVFGDESQLSTETILARLNDIDESPWGDIYGKPLDARGLARRLKPYGVSRSTVRTTEGIKKGYYATDLWDAWKRYLPSLSSSSPDGVTEVTTGTLFDGDTCPKCSGAGCEWCER